MLMCLCASSSQVLVRVICDLLCDAVCGVCNCMSASGV